MRDVCTFAPHLADFDKFGSNLFSLFYFSQTLMIIYQISLWAWDSVSFFLSGYSTTYAKVGTKVIYIQNRYLFSFMS